MTDPAKSHSPMPPGQINKSCLDPMGAAATTIMTAASMVAATAGVLIAAHPAGARLHGT